MLALLLQWADSAYPTGGFAYSSGLEAMARLPAFTTLEHLSEYLRLVLRQALSADMPYLLGLHEAAQDTQSFEALAWEWDAFLHQPVMRRSSLAQGEAWLRLNPQVTLDIVAPKHFVPVLAWSAARQGVASADLRMLYLHLLLRDQIAASVRLGLIGANQAQSLQAELGPVNHPEWALAPVVAPEDASRGAPVLELVQALHSDMYVRLFQN
jgi:urease accessory protein